MLPLYHSLDCNNLDLSTGPADSTTIEHEHVTANALTVVSRTCMVCIYKALESVGHLWFLVAVGDLLILEISENVFRCLEVAWSGCLHLLRTRVNAESNVQSSSACNVHEGANELLIGADILLVRISRAVILAKVQPRLWWCILIVTVLHVKVLEHSLNVCSLIQQYGAIFMVLGELDSQMPVQVTTVREFILLLQSSEELLVEFFVVVAACSVIALEAHK